MVVRFCSPEREDTHDVLRLRLRGQVSRRSHPDPPGPTGRHLGHAHGKLVRKVVGRQEGGDCRIHLSARGVIWGVNGGMQAVPAGSRHAEDAAGRGLGKALHGLGIDAKGGTRREAANGNAVGEPAAFHPGLVAVADPKGAAASPRRLNASRKPRQPLAVNLLPTGRAKGGPPIVHQAVGRLSCRLGPSPAPWLRLRRLWGCRRQRCTSRLPHSAVHITHTHINVRPWTIIPSWSTCLAQRCRSAGSLACRGCPAAAPPTWSCRNPTAPPPPRRSATR